MPKEDFIDVPAKAIESLPHGQFKVQLETGQRIFAYLASKMWIHYTRIVPGDTVMVELSAYDLKHGRITYRVKHEAA
jgi:translation initiation factor IF-1